ncbi:MAG: hypothetical protein ACJ8AK_15455 [Gemmatimonadaceae bacterium]
MRPNLLCATVAVVTISASTLPAQARATADANSSAIAASFSKFKSLSKEKRGIKKEKYLKVESKPAVLANPADYSGAYEVPDLHMRLELNVKSDGSFTGTGYEQISDGVMREFSLRDGRIDRAFATATKVYANATETFQGAFMNRSTYESPTDKGVTVFGLGTIGRAIYVDGNTFDRFFFQKLP